MALLSATADLPSRLVSPTIRRLPNGLTVIAEQMPLEVVNLSLWLRVGSAVESDAINGMAHFLEHMIFKGTQQLQCGEFERQVEERGALTNAATSQDYTKYYITTAPQDFAALAPLQIQMVMAPRLSDHDFERERPVILEEIRRADDNPRRRTYSRTMELVFDRLPYRRPVLGPTAVVGGLTPAQMREFHSTWYQPQNMTAVAVGNLPVETLIATVAEGFEQVMAQRHTPLDTANSIERFKPLLPDDLEPPFATVRRATHTDPAMAQARLVMAWRVPGVAQLEDTYGLDILASILGRGLTSRLVRDLREERKLVTSISCSNMTLAHQGAFMMSAQLPAENLGSVEEAIAQHIATVMDEPVSSAELSRMQTQVANRFIFANETPSDRAGLYGYYHTLTGDITEGLNYPAYIQKLGVKDVLQSAQRHLSSEAYGVVTLQPAA
ncbi:MULTISPECIES: pitrilysin family protein [Cyanophyceae]|uniref:M16 family metallopeptidase n=1 Tax=Cyanophyceae TaxID=3028117 RepID=UPI00168883AC|nr:MULTISPECIES: pitrilysin family protein [Cyanophyceae]MBD1914491.1 insulinase family protein [Phormidium sp. FACHB-77]MBD2031064.1 insulinase family protein [Phormidium sp. FACHB-322]MBD2052103.1 insulinase family protein [Leptolyngbya sp. FACHB-60]